MSDDDEDWMLCPECGKGYFAAPHNMAYHLKNGHGVDIFPLTSHRSIELFNQTFNSRTTEAFAKVHQLYWETIMGVEIEKPT